jgi:hypothetical protein
MRLYASKIPMIAEEVVRDLSAAGDIEVENGAEVRLDIEAVLKEFVRADREISDESKDRMQQRGLPSSNLGKLKAQVAKERNAPPPDEQLPYLLEQIMNMLFHSANVSEVFADDTELRKKITPILKRHMDVETDLDAEVRSKIKNLQEGTATFEIEYAKVMDQMKRKKGLT